MSDAFDNSPQDQTPPPVERKDFISTMLDYGEYDSKSRSLLLVFNNGGEYTLDGVPKEVWVGLRDSRSPGAYFIEHMRGKF